MDMIEMAREIGRTLQQDERYIRATNDSQLVNASEELKKMISDFDDVRAKMEFEMAQAKGQMNDTIMDLDEQMHAHYDRIYSHPLMVNYEASRKELEALVNYMMKIITASANGQNPDTVLEEEDVNCTGSCSTCGGCS